MKILVGCEFSGVVREAFRARGHDAVSCDLLPSELPGPHIVGDLFDHLDDGWDMLIFFWPCTNMACSGALHFKKKRKEQTRDVLSFARLALSPQIPKVAGENPVGVLSTKFRKPDQIIQPYQFGHGDIKTTCLWLKGLPKLKPTKIVKGRRCRILEHSPHPDRWKLRSRTYQGIADAMAEQWGAVS